MSKKSLRSISDRKEWNNNPESSAHIKPGFSVGLKKLRGKIFRKIFILLLSCTAWQHTREYKEKWDKSHIHVILS